jgi:hypothetical protein
MQQAPVSAPPPAYMEIIAPLIAKARDFLESGQQLEAFAFVGNLTTKNVMPVPIDPGSETSKDTSALTIESAAELLEADFVFTVMEAWSLRPDKMPQMDAILDKYGSVGASPFAIDVCALTLETKRGVWIAQPGIKFKGASKKKRTFGPVEFRYYDSVEGRFTNMLPAKPGDEPPAILH